MRKSIFTEFFSLSAAVIFSAVICSSTLFLIVSGEYYKNDKKRYLDGLMTAAAQRTESCTEENGRIDISALKAAYESIAENTEAVFTLTDINGDVLVCSEAPPCCHTDRPLPLSVVSQVGTEGFFELSTLENYYSEDYFNIAYSISINGIEYILFGKLSSKSLTDYLSRLIPAMLIVAVLIIALVFLILYVYMSSIFSPLREMTMAARRFGAGDFSAKLDITDKNEFGFLANSLNEMASSLEEIENSRKSFISNVSHELKTPMTTIGGFVDGILDGTIPPERHGHYLKIVSAEVNRLARLVRSMLNVSKYEAGELKINPDSFDIVPMVITTLLSFEKRIDEKEIDIRGLDRDPLIVTADRDMVQQIVYNLTENAVKFVDKGGYIEFTFTENDDEFAVVVRNSGEGLKENEISRVFERFYKTDESRGIDPGGVGLGLSIVSSLVKLHGGTILVRSEPGRFTEFEFTLKKTADNSTDHQ